MFALKYTKGILCDMWVYLRTSTGRVLRQAGLQLDRRGLSFQGNIPHLQPLNRHRNILSLYDKIPQISPSAYIAPNATVYGDVFVGQNSYLGFGSVAKGQVLAIRVGSNTKIGENTVLQSNPLGEEEVYPLSVNIGNNVNIQHNCHLMSCIVDDDVHIGHRSVVMQGSQLQRGSVIGPNSYVPAGSRIPAYTVWAGVPVRFVKNIEKQQISKIQAQNDQQIRIAQK